MNTFDEPRPGVWHYLRTVLLGAAGSGLLFSASLAVPFIGFVAGFLAAVPLCYTRLSSGRRAALLATLIAALMLGGGFRPPIGIWYLLQCGLVGLLLPELILRGMTALRALLWTTAIAVTASALMAFGMALSAGQDLFTMAQQEITTGMAQAMKLYEQQQGLSPQDLETIRQGMQTVATTLIRIFPALASLNLLLIGALSLLFLRRMAQKREMALSITPFCDFRVPEGVIWFLIVAGFSLLAPSTLLTTPALNIIVILAVLYFCQGLAVLVTLAGRTTYAGMLKVMLTLVLLLQPYLLPVVAILGIFDLWGDFRTPRPKQEENL